MRLEKEFKSGRDQSDAIQKQLLEAKRDAESSSKESTEAVQMMNEMRNAHLQEVRLLQRGLQARGSDEKFRNRVNEVADLVDKLGRSVVQRDEAVRDKAKAQAQMNKMIVDLRALADECSKLRRTNKSLESNLKEAKRKGKAAVPPPIDRALAELDESDEEFETELLHFEKRFKILEEGPMGLDVLASNLARDKRLLEKALKQQQEAHRAVCASLEEWKALANEKDKTITRQNEQIEEMMMAQAALEEEIERKRNEIAEAVNTERAKLEERMEQLRNEAEEARADAESAVAASDKLSQELVKVHEQYDEAAQRKQAAKAELAGGEAPGEWEMTDEEATDRNIKVSELEAPCALNLAVWTDRLSKKVQLRAKEKNGTETRIPVSEDVLAGLDSSDGSPWADLYSRVGRSSDPMRIVLSERLGEKELPLPPNDASVFCKVYRFDQTRYYISGVSMATTFMSDYVICQDELATDDDLIAAIEAGTDGSELMDLLLSRMSFQDEGDGFYFGAD